jgi:1-acyl-sn-glycerol-3-phosphate acyltransferase
MGLGLSLATVYEMAKITAPTFAEALVGRVTRDKVDDRATRFSRRVLERARIRLEVVGRELVDPDRAYVYMSNHQSHLDIPVLYSAIPSRTVRMVAKTELFRIPIFGRAMRAAGFVEVDRKNREAAIDSLRRAAAAIADGVSIWIAPEGHRSATGALGPLKKGGFHLAADSGTPIVPVAITGTLAVLPPGSRSMRPDLPVRVDFGAPIATAGRPIPALMEEVRAFLRTRIEAT